jgi:hypothetical protein
MSEVSNNCLDHKCISGSAISERKCLDQTFETKDFNNYDRPCINIPFNEYYSTLISVVQSNWIEASFYLIKSGIGSKAKMGFLGIDHSAVLMEIRQANPPMFKYHIVGEVEVGDSNIVVNVVTAKGAIFPTFTSTAVQEPIWKGNAVILAGPICYDLNDDEMNMEPVQRAGALLSVCGLTQGSGNPVPLLYLSHNTEKTRNKLTKFIDMINTIDVNNSYIFLGFKSFQSDTKCVTGHPYTCETFASIMASYLYREFREHIENNSKLLNYYQSFMLKPFKTNNSCTKNLPDDAILTTMYQGRYKNAQLFLHVEQATFLDADNHAFVDFKGKTWNQMNQNQQLDCFNFWYFATNNASTILTSLAEIYSEKNIAKKIVLIEKMIGYILLNVKTGPFNNIWIKAYPQQASVFCEPVFFCTPLKTYNILSKKYEYSSEKILNILLLTESSIQKESDFDPIINMKLINDLFPENKCKTKGLFFMIVGIILLVFLILILLCCKPKKSSL